MGTTIGTIIKELREEQDISRSKLCKGICSAQMLNLIEQDACETDKYMLDILLQRLGKSPDRLELIISNEEYKSMRVRDLIEELCWKKKKEKALYLLEKYMNCFPGKNNVLKIYELRINAYISRRIDGDSTAAEDAIINALEITLPGIDEKNMLQYMISSTEMENLLALGLCLIDKEDLCAAERLLEACRSYIISRMSDEEQRAAIYSKCAWLLSKVYIKQQKISEAYYCCEEAVRGLGKYGNLYFMLPLLEQLVFCSDEMKLNRMNNCWIRYREVLQWLYDSYGMKWYCHDSLFHNFCRLALHLDSEFIRQERQAKRITQEKLIEGVYQSPESLSRVESGKVRPSKTKFEGLLKNLGIERGRICGTLAVENFQALEMKQQIAIFIGEGDYERAKLKLSELESMLNMEWKINQMIVGNYREVLNSHLMEGYAREALENQIKLLQLTYWTEKKQFERVPMQSELLIFNAMVINLEKLGMRDEAVSILQQIVDTIKRSKMKDHYRSHIASLPYVNFAINTDNEELCKRGLQYELRCDNAVQLPHYLEALSNIAETQGKRQEAEKMLLYAYHLCEIFNKTAYKAILKDLYEELTGQCLND